MPRARFFNLGRPQREQLLAIATRHFARSGLEGASLNEILAEAGLSKGVYYYYFDDKDDLFATVLENALDSMVEKIPFREIDDLDRASFWPTIENLFREGAATFASPDLVLAASQLTEARRASPRFAPLLKKVHRFYGTFVEKGQHLGCVRKDVPLEVLVRLLEVIDAVLDASFLSSGNKISETRIDAHMRLVFDLFRRLLEERPRSVTRRPVRKGARHG